MTCDVHYHMDVLQKQNIEKFLQVIRESYPADEHPFTPILQIDQETKICIVKNVKTRLCKKKKNADLKDIGDRLQDITDLVII